MSIFENILNDLSSEMSIDLKEDNHHSCLLTFEDKIKVQLELDKPQENLVLGSIIDELPPGKFRENILKAALIENGLEIHKKGIFAYSERKNALIFFKKIPLNKIKPKELLIILYEFKDKALEWKEAISRGNIPQVSEQIASKSPSSSIFNIH